MHIALRLVPCLALLLAACSDSREVADELPNSSIAGAPREEVSESRMDAPLDRPVTIGEDGPRLDACGALGVAGRLGDGGALELRAAPFRDARVVQALPPGTRMHVCTRSIDQRWLGVVVAPAPVPPEPGDDSNIMDPASPLDCGVSTPVDSKRNYEGPCASGWVSSAYVQLIAG